MLRVHPILIVLIAAAPTAVHGQQPESTPRIRSVIAQINRARSRADSKAFSMLFAPDGVLMLDAEAVGNGPGAIEKALDKPRIWNEMTTPVIQIDSVRFAS